jgi:pilus assembly protein CpaF
MSFFGNKKQIQPERVIAEANNEPPTIRAEDHYADMIARRPSLLDERLKLHALIIDEFNLAALDKLPPEELARQVRTYVGNYAREESLSLNQKELDFFPTRLSTK